VTDTVTRHSACALTTSAPARRVGARTVLLSEEGHHQQELTGVTATIAAAALTVTAVSIAASAAGNITKLIEADFFEFLFHSGSVRWGFVFRLFGHQ